MKKIALVTLFVAAVFTIQLNFTSAKSGSDTKLNQLVQKAEACFEVLPYGYPCCESANWCYIGGGYEIWPFYFGY
jgi:hypothetical protein